MTMRPPLSKDNFITIISVYPPTMTNPDENKEAFFNQLASVLSGIPRTDKLLLIGDGNARIGRDHDKWPLVMGKHGTGNSSGELLLALRSEFELIVTNTMFKQNNERKTPWMDPRSRHWHIGVGIRWASTVPEPCVELTAVRSPDIEIKTGFQNTTGKEQVNQPSST